MKDKILSAKEFAYKHRLVVIYSAGVLVGGYFTYTQMRTRIPNTVEVLLKESPEEIKQMLDRNGGVLPINSTNLRHRTIFLHTGVDPSLVK